MAMSTFAGPMRIGDTSSGTLANVGTPLLSQATRILADGTDTVDATLYLPTDAIIVEIIVDVLTAWDSATSATLTVGSASGGTQYAGGVNLKTGSRVYPTHTKPQLAAMADIGGTTPVVVTATPVGATTAGEAKVTILYAMI